MATQHYNFPTVNGADPIRSVDALNGLANAVDTALYVVDAEATSATTAASGAAAAAATANATATAASETAAAAQQEAGAASSTAASAAETAGSASTKAAKIVAAFNLSETETATNVAHTGSPSISLTLAQNAYGTVFTFSGTIYNEGTTAATLTKVAIPGGSGAYAYGVATGLYLESVVSRAFMVKPAGMKSVYHTTTSTNVDAGVTGFAVGTNGQVYIQPASANTAESLPNTGRTIMSWIGSIHFNGDIA